MNKTPPLQQNTKIVFLTIIIIAITAFIYWNSPNNEFVNYDDEQIIVNNPALKSLDINKLFSITEYRIFGAQYKPITLFSFALEYQLFQNDPFYYHLHNVILHIFNIILVILFLYVVSNRNFIIIAFGGLLFAVHPLNVEAVSWASGRKDVLSTFFMLTCLLLYFKYSSTSIQKKNRPIFYLLFFTSFILASLSKLLPAITPLIMIVYDYTSDRKWSKFCIIEKLPLIAVSIALLTINSISHLTTGKSDIPTFNIFSYAMNGINALSFYLFKSLIPVKLSVFYQAGSLSFSFMIILFLLFLLL